MIGSEVSTDSGQSINKTTPTLHSVDIDKQY